MATRWQQHDLFLSLWPVLEVLTRNMSWSTHYLLLFLQLNEHLLPSFSQRNYSIPITQKWLCQAYKATLPAEVTKTMSKYLLRIWIMEQTALHSIHYSVGSFMCAAWDYYCHFLLTLLSSAFIISKLFLLCFISCFYFFLSLLILNFSCFLHVFIFLNVFICLCKALWAALSMNAIQINLSYCYCCSLVLFLCLLLVKVP